MSVVRGKASPPDSFCLATRSQTCFSVPQVPAPSLTCYIGEETKDNSDMAELFRRETTASQEEEEEEVDGEEITELMEHRMAHKLCECHVTLPSPAPKKARNKLVLACLIALVFMTAEVIGGYFANSLAIMTDAAHMLSDFGGFMISLFALWVGSRKPTKRMSFGWHRAEVVGAVVSVLVIWVLTGVLVYEAILRIINQDYEIEADIMLITAAGGVFVNVFMMAVLGHGHSHGGDSLEDGGHHHGNEKGHHHNRQSDCHRDNVQMNFQTWWADEDPDDKPPPVGMGRRFENINVRAAFIHVIGDLIQSVGVVIAGYIIKFWPDWKVADPICTFLFSILVLFSTINILRDALLVLMEATPHHTPYDDVLGDLQRTPGVRHAHNLHLWSLTTNTVAMSAHLATYQDAKTREVLDRANSLLRVKYGIEQVTLQVEEYSSSMEDCHTCQNALPKRRLGRRTS